MTKRGFADTSMETMRLAARVCNLASEVAVPPSGEEPDPTPEECDLMCDVEVKMLSLIDDLERLRKDQELCK